MKFVSQQSLLASLVVVIATTVNTASAVTPTWTEFASKSGGQPYSESIPTVCLTNHVNDNEAIIRRQCNSCANSHKDIYYKRLTSVPDQAAFDANSPVPTDFIDLFTNNWMSTPSNVLNVDFNLYSSYEDAVNDRNAWTDCNYNDATVGFPRDCGPNGKKGSQWTSKTRSWRDFTFSVEGEVSAFCEEAFYWDEVAGKSGGTYYQNVKDANFAAHVTIDRNTLIYRRCDACKDSHKDIYYKRITSVPDQVTFDTDAGDAVSFLDLFVNNWMSTPSNVLNVDFNLYSSYEDAVNDANAWTACNYDDATVGFPRDCGPSGYVGSQWGSKSRGKDFVLYVRGAVEYGSWDVVAEKVNGSPKIKDGADGALMVHHLMTTNGIVRRTCDKCYSEPHKDIYYKRITPFPTAEDFSTTVATDFLNLFTTNWMTAPKNAKNVDFKLYGTYEDALMDTNAWTYYNFNDASVGFPRDCSPSKFTGGQWGSFTRWSPDFKIMVEGTLPSPDALPNALPEYGEWDDIASATNNVVSIEINDVILRQHMATTNGIIRRFCPSCSNKAHKEIYYKRITSLPDPTEFDGKVPDSFLDLFLANWFDEPKNLLDVDFELYSSYSDARTGQNRWTKCNYNDPTVGFPRDCGPYGTIGGGWTSTAQTWTKDFTFQVEGDMNAIIEAAALPAYTEWDDVAKQDGASKDIFTIDSVLIGHLATTNAIIRRLCPNCKPSHQEIYYRRLTPIATPKEYADVGKASGFIDQLLNNWMSTPHNLVHNDFELFSTYDDALKGINRWTFCNYGDSGVGFPRDCGPRGYVASAWNSFERNTGRDFTFSVEGTLPPLPPVIPLPDMGGWTSVAKKDLGIPNECLSDAEFRAQIVATNGIVRRLCPECTASHREIYYKRITPLPAQSDFDGQIAKNFLDLFLDNWMRAPHNVLNTDFELFSTYDDALKGTNKWTYCNYDDSGVGFPRDCGPHGYVPSAWTSVSRSSKDFVFEVEGVLEGEHGCKPPPKSCTATGWGDPHIITFDGLKYDTHAVGEVIMMMSLDSALMVQARLVKVLGHGAEPAVTAGIAVKENPKADGTLYPLVQVSMASTPESQRTLSSCPVELYIDKVKQVNLADGYNANDVEVQVHMNTGRIVIDYPDLHLSMKVLKFMGTCHFTVTYALLNDCRPEERVIGLLGSPDDNALNDWMTRDGTVLDIPPGSGSFFFEPAYKYTTQNWCVYIENESIFTYEEGYDFDHYEHCGVDYNPDLERSLEEATEKQKKICGEGNTACLMDAAILGDGAAEEAIEAPGVDEEEPMEIQKLKTQISEIGGLPDTPDGGDVSDTEDVSGSLGDPHFRTWKNEHFEYHGQCDLMLAKDPEFAGGLGIEVEIRTKLVRYWSYIKSAAIRIGSDVLEVQGSDDPKVGVAHYWMNFEYQAPVSTIGGFPVTMTMKSIKKQRFLIDLSSKYPGEKIEISTYREFVKVDFVNSSEASFGNAVGMLGELKTGKTLGRDGSEVNDFLVLGSEWQVRPDESMLFNRFENPQFPKACVIPEDPQGERRRRLDEQSVTEEQAEAACAGLNNPLDRKDCVYDILATQDLDMVGAF